MAVSQTKHCYSLKVKIFGPPNFGLGAGAQPALHFGGGGNFHEISFDDVIVWYNLLFRKRSHIIIVYFCPQTRSP